VARRATRPKTRKRKYARSEKRVRAALPVALGRAAGITRDVSASGAYIETDASCKVGSPVHFAIQLATPWGPAHFDCRGTVVRIERHDGTLGVAVRFSDADVPRASARPPRRGR
jgi:PilZ domain-containing protein